jgi:hypothetical protein
MNYSRKTTIPKIRINRINPAVIKKLYFRSGNKSVSRIPFVSIIGFTALNNITDVPSNIPTTISFIIHEDKEPEDTENGLIKNRITISRETHKRTHEYFVFSLYCTM